MARKERNFKGAMYGRDVKGNSSDILGFINRDKQITERLPVPAQVFPLGRDFMHMVHDAFSEQAATSLIENTTYGSDVTSYVSEHEAVPGIATLWFNPVFSTGAKEEDSITQPVYQAKWQSARNLDNMTKNWQPGDMQAVDLGLSLSVMMAHVVRRALSIMRDVRQKSENAFYNSVAMLKAMGFEFSLNEIASSYDNLWSAYNKGIVGRINALQWLTYSFPGARRWARLCDNIYRDTPLDTRYAQYYIFMPKYIPTFEDQVVNPDGTVSYRIDCLRRSTSDHTSTPVTLLEWLTNIGSAVPIGQRGTQQMYALIDKITDFMDNLFYSDSTNDIIATLNAMEKRNLTSALTQPGSIDIERIDFEDLNSDHRAPEMYDETILIAVSNATNAPYLVTTPAMVNAKTGFMEQHVYVDKGDTNTPADEKAARENALPNLNHPKVINFPNVVPTQSDYISATQWTICSPLFDTDASINPTSLIEKAAVGSDYIAGVSILARDVTGAYYSKITDPRAFYAHPVSCNVFHLRSKTLLDDLLEADPTTDFVQKAYHSLSEYEYLQQFALFPQVNSYDFGIRLIPGSTSYMPTYVFDGPIVQSDVYFIATSRELARFHEQWFANFYGYPVYGEFGTPVFSTEHGKSSFGLSETKLPTSFDKSGLSSGDSAE